MVLTPGTHYLAELTEAIWIMMSAQGQNMLTQLIMKVAPLCYRQN